MNPSRKEKPLSVTPDDIVSIVILSGCFFLIGLGKDQQGIVTHILEVTIGILLGRRSKAVLE